ncbi:unknown [Prevotella sp. CAG:924]|nr:unknown [Prevotella sp. CAG:924]
MQHPHRAEQGDFAVIVRRGLQLYLTELGMGRHGDIEIRTAQHRQRVALAGHVRQHFISVRRERYLLPTCVDAVTVQPERTERIQAAVRRLRHGTYLPIVCSIGQSVVEVGECGSGSVRPPDATRAIDQHTAHAVLVRIGQCAPQQATVPFRVFVTDRQPLPADVDITHKPPVVQHDARQTEHQQKKAERDAQPLMMFFPCDPFHAVAVCFLCNLLYMR